MSSQPHTVLPWVVRRTRLPLLSLRCVDCRSESATTGEGRFRVNAHGNLLDPMLAQRNHFSLDWKEAWRLDTPSAWLAEAWPVQVEVVFKDPVPVRPERLIAQGLGPSRNEVRRRIKCAIPLCRPRTAGFTFTVMARAYQRGRRRRA
jgi:hypothetical protein